MKRRGRQKNDTKRSTKQDHKPFGNVCRPSGIPVGAGGAGSRAAIPDIQHHIPLYRGTNHRVLRCGTGGKRGIPASKGKGRHVFFFYRLQQSRDNEGTHIQGEDEAMEIADKAQGWFLLSGRKELSQAGIVVEDVNNVQQRNTLMVDKEANRYGFDVLIRYIRDDKTETGALEKVIVKGKEKNE